MPKVGKANYPYTQKGVSDAREHSKRTGEPIDSHEYSGGGKVPKYQYGGRVPSGFNLAGSGFNPGRRGRRGSGIHPRLGGNPWGGGQRSGSNRMRSMFGGLGGRRRSGNSWMSQFDRGPGHFWGGERNRPGGIGQRLSPPGRKGKNPTGLQGLLNKLRGKI